MGDNDQKKEKSGVFSIEGETQAEIPSVTKLLNRKSLGIDKKDPKKKSVSPSPIQSPDSATPPPQSTPKPSPIPEPLIEPKPPGTSPSSGSSTSGSDRPGEILINFDSPEANQFELETRITPTQSSVTETQPVVESQPHPAPTTHPSIQLQTQTQENEAPKLQEPSLSAIVKISPPKIQPAARRSTRTSSQLILWEPQQLKSGTDPLGKGIAEMLKKGATQALFLAITPPPTGSPVPHFVSTAAVAPQEKLNLWTGLKWDPTVVPELWNYFVKSGVAELSPPGTMTNQASHRNVVRAAFGITRSEWLLLVRAGSAQACRGVIAFVSTKTLMNDIKSALPLITSDLPKKNAS